MQLDRMSIILPRNILASERVHSCTESGVRSEAFDSLRAFQDVFTTHTSGTRLCSAENTP